MRNRMRRALEAYAEFVSTKPQLLLAVILVFTVIMAVMSTRVHTKSMNYQSMLPKSVEEIRAMFKIGDEFGRTSSTMYIVIRTDGGGIDDVLSPASLRYMASLEEKLKTLPFVESTNSIADFVISHNNGTIPPTTGDVLRVIENSKRVCPPPGMAGGGHGGGDISSALRIIAENSASLASAQRNISTGIIGIAAGISKVSLALKRISEGMRNGHYSLDAMVDAYTQLYMLNYTVAASPTLSPQEKQAMFSMISQLERDLNEIADSFQNMGKRLDELADALNGMALSLDAMSKALVSMANAVNGTAKGNEMISNALENVSSAMFVMETRMKEIAGNHNKETKKCVTIDPLTGFVSDDRSTAIIYLSIQDVSENKRKEVVHEVKDIVESVPTPPGLEAEVGGNMVYLTEIRSEIGEIMGKTSSISMISILIIVCLLLYSVRFGLISLLSILFGTIWVYGMFGTMGISVSPQTSGALSMIMGIGIDFGIQVVNRFKQELRKTTAEKAMKIAVTRTFYPMLITTLSALIGFRAMSMGTITVLKELGVMMSYGVAMCFIAAITVVPSSALLMEKLRIRRR